MSFTLDSERKLNTEIMNVYDSIKNIKHFDYGFVNCDYSFRYSNLEKLNEDFVMQVKAFIKNKRYNSKKYKQVKDILDEQMISIDEDGNNDFFEEFLYDIASVLRDFDGHGLDENYNITGKYEETGEDYPVIHDLKRSGSDFLEEVLVILPNNSVPVTFQKTYSFMGISAGLYFSIIYGLLLKAVLGKEPPIVSSRKTRTKIKSRGGTRRRRKM